MDYLLYFFPDARSVTDALLRECELLPVVGGMRIAMTGVSGGPSGLNGQCAVFHDGDAPVRPKYDETLQVWRECAGGRFWIGYWRDHVPGPADLARQVQVGGHLVELADGKKWLIPLVRQFDGGTAVPRVIRYRADGTFEHDINPKYTDFYERGMQVWECVMQENAWGHSEDWVIETAAWALTVNYRIGKWEASAIGLFDTRNVNDVVQAIVDGPTYKRWIDLKKNAQATEDSSSVSDGSEGSLETTNQPAQT